MCWCITICYTPNHLLLDYRYSKVLMLEVWKSLHQGNLSCMDCMWCKMNLFMLCFTYKLYKTCSKPIPLDLDSWPSSLSCSIHISYLGFFPWAFRIHQSFAPKYSITLFLLVTLTIFLAIWVIHFAWPFVQLLNQC